MLAVAESSVRTNLIGLSADLPSLAMTKNGPGHARIHELRHGYLPGEGAVWLIKDVLGCDFDVLADDCPYKGQVDGWRCYDDLFEAIGKRSRRRKVN
jgi:hypothetical protein